MVATKKESTLTASVDQTKALSIVKAIEKEATELAEGVGAPDVQMIETDHEYTVAGDVLIGIVERRKYVEEQREGFLEDVRKMIARVESWFTPVLDTIGKAESYYRSQLEGFIKAKDAEAEALRQTAALSKTDKRAAELLEQANAIAPPKVPGIAIRRPTKVVVTDAKKLPKKFFVLAVDTKKLAVALEAGEKIPGAQLVVNVGLTVTPKNAKKDED